MTRPYISVVTPVYKAELMVDGLVERIQKVLSVLTDDFEIILVEDGSADASWTAIEKVVRSMPKVKGVKLSRNFGQHNAITAGLDESKGDWVVVMDCDLQDRPEEIPKLLSEARKGFDIVYARRSDRNDSFLKKLSSVIFYKFFGWISGVPQDSSIANFGIYSRNAINAVNSLREPLRSFATMIKWVGFKSSCVSVEHAKREVGKSTYSFRKLLQLALDISIAFSDKPLKLTVKLGAIISLGSVIFGIITLIRYFSGLITEPGYTSLILSIWFLSGLIIFVLGVLGLYLGKVFEGVKRRPLYIVEKVIEGE